ncbi:MAG: agmatinase [Deltaproteobacteria bacterium]|nr:agmatinase [Deltaproteobacteria bacterium]
MKPHPTPFLSPPPERCALEHARVVVLPFPYEGGISYGAGAAAAPRAILEASAQLEFYDEVLEAEPLEMGIATVETPQIPPHPEGMVHTLFETVRNLLERDKFVVVLGGDHSITSGSVRAFMEKNEALGVIQLDAHADLRETYDGSPLSHACVMARIREITPHTVQLGIRSLSAEEARRVQQDGLLLSPLHQWRQGAFDLQEALRRLPERVFITVDVDVFDWSVVSSTGTPEPGGLFWDEALGILKTIFDAKDVVGFDVVELAYKKDDMNSPFAVAKLIYKMIGFKFHRQLTRIC